MSHLGQGTDEPEQGVFLNHNDSGRFECRYVTVRVYDSPSVMLKGMAGSVFGMWSAHGEGRDISCLQTVIRGDCVKLRFKKAQLIVQLPLSYKRSL